MSLEGRARQVKHQFSSPDRSRSPAKSSQRPVSLLTAQAPSSLVAVSSPITPASKTSAPQDLRTGMSSERTAREKSAKMSPDSGARLVRTSAADDEKEKLRQENDKLTEILRRKEQQHQRDLEELKTLRENDFKLRQKIDKDSRDKASEPIVFQPRGHRNDGFNIHSWDKERLGLSIPVVDARDKEHVVAGVGEEKSGSPSAGEASGALALVTSESVQLSTSTVSEPSFADVQGLEEEDAEALGLARQHLLLGNADAVATALRDLLAKNTEDSRGYHACKYLSFSRSLALLLDHVRAPATALCEVTPRTDGAAVGPLMNLAAVLQQLASSAQFSNEPPKCRPQEVSRLLYVRALCAQIGLALDSARVGFIERRERQSRLLEGIREVAHSENGSPSRARSRSRDVVAAGYRLPKKELEFLLKKAGTFLLAVQMDMDRLHEEAVDRIEEAKEAKRKRAEVQHEYASTSLAPSEVAETQQSLAADTLIDTVTEPSDTHDLALTNGDHASDASASEACAHASCADDAVVAKDSDEGQTARPLAESGADMEEEEPPPSFGDFLVKDLMPLYVKDVPFSNLRCIAEKYCGLSLDSDDEDRVWRAAGRNGKPKAQAPRRHPHRHPASDPKNQGRVAAGKPVVSADAVATPKEEKVLFSQQVHAVQKPIVSSGSKMRFLTSVVQKDNKIGLSAIPGSLAKQALKSGRGRHADAAAVRLISPAFFMSPGPSSSSGRAPAMSPVSMRGGVMSRTPQTQRVSVGASWGMMEATPVHQKRA